MLRFTNPAMRCTEKIIYIMAEKIIINLERNIEKEVEIIVNEGLGGDLRLWADYARDSDVCRRIIRLIEEYQLIDKLEKMNIIDIIDLIDINFNIERELEDDSEYNMNNIKSLLLYIKRKGILIVEDMKPYSELINLIEFLRVYNFTDNELDYPMPEIRDIKEMNINSKKLEYKQNKLDKNCRPEIKKIIARLNSPMIKINEEFKEIYYQFIENNFDIGKLDGIIEDRIQELRENKVNLLYNHIKDISRISNYLNSKYNIDISKIRIDRKNTIDYLHLIEEYFEDGSDNLNPKILNDLAKEFATIDLNIKQPNYDKSKVIYPNYKIEIPALYYMVNKYRGIIRGVVEREDYLTNQEIYIDKTTIINLDNKCHIISDKRIKLLIIINNSFSSIIDLKRNKIHLLSSSMLDHLFTSVETQLNLITLIKLKEREPIAISLKKLLDINKDEYLDYDDKIAFYRGFETLCLKRSDSNSRFINWTSVLDTVNGFNFIDSRSIFAFMGFRIRERRTIYLDIIIELSKLSSEELINISAMHKFFYFSDIKETKGIEKFLKRNHHKREVDPLMIRNLKQKFRQILIYSYYKSNRKLPNIKCKPEIKLELETILSGNSDMSDFRKLGLEYFEDIKFEKTFEKIEDKDTLLYAKDKACSVTNTNFDDLRSENELEGILRKEKYEMIDNFEYEELAVKRKKCPFIVSNVLVVTGQSLKNAVELNQPINLCMKEREQKDEGRLFACAKLENKHILSYLNRNIERILPLIPGQLMNIDNNRKYKDLSKASQLLNRSDYYCILTDIEGHNQSIQVELMTCFIEEIQDLFGDELDFKKMINFFKEQDIFYCFEYLNKFIYTRGQNGCLEGYMNQLWTIITQVMTLMIEDKTDIILEKAFCYSDDIALITRIENIDNRKIEETYNKLMNYYKKFGFIIKPSQTIITKNRLTMLRNHYINGKKGDTTVKKVNSISSFNENYYVCEETDLRNLNSSINSALEFSSIVKEITYIKWQRIILITYKNYTKFLLMQSLYKYQNKLKDKSILNEELNPVVGIFSEMSKLVKIYEEHKNPEERIQFLKNEIGHVKSWQLEMDEYLFNRNTNNVMSIIQHDDNLKFFWLSRMMLPENFQGIGVPAIFDSMTHGYSNSMIKKLYVVQYIAKSYKKEKLFIRILSSKMFIRDIDIEKLFVNEIPIDNNREDLNNIISKEILKAIKKINKNESFKKYLEIKDKATIIRKVIIDLLRQKYSVRIAQYYYERSPLTFYNSLHTKLLESMRFTKKINPDKKTTKLLTMRNKFMWFNFNSDDSKSLKLETYQFLDNLSLCDNLLRYRSLTIKNINIINEVEPYYEDNISLGSYENHDLVVEKGEPTYLEGGFKVYKSKDYNKKIGMKYTEQIKELYNYNMQFTLAIELVVVTRWIIKHDKLTRDEQKNNNFILLCDWLLSYISKYTYQELICYIDDLKGGQILHRLRTFSFKIDTYINSLLDLDLKYDVKFNFSNNLQFRLEDSNINFDYLRNYIKMIYMMKDYIYDESTNLRYIKFIIKNNIIQDVKLIKYSYNVQLNLGNMTSLGINIYTIDKLEVLERTFEKAIFKKNNKNEPNKEERIILDFYFNLKNDYLAVGPYNMLGNTWDAFLNKLRLTMGYEGGTGFLHELIYNTILTFQFNYKKIDDENLKHNLSKINDRLFIKSKKLTMTLFQGFKRCYKLIMNELKKEKADIFSTVSQNVSNELASILENIRGPKFVKWFSIIMIFKYCIQCRKDSNNNNYIHIPDTLDLYFKIIETGLYSLKNQKIFTEVLNIYGHREFKENVNIYRDKISNLLKVIIKNIKLKDYNYDTKPTFKIDQEPNYDDLNFDVPAYNHIDINLNNIVKPIQSLVEKERSLINLKCSALSLYSETHSDTVTAGLALANYLINEYGNNLEILDLASGRGDIRDMLVRKGLRVYSHSKKDFFNMVFKRKETNYSDFDLTERKFLRDLTMSSIVVIDISFIKGEKHNMMDNIFSIITQENLNKKVILRINSIPTKIIRNSLMKNLETYNRNNSMRKIRIKIRFLYAQMSEIMPYHKYFEISAVEDNTFVHDSIRNLTLGVNIKNLIFNRFTSFKRINYNTSGNRKIMNNSQTIKIKDIFINMKDIINNFGRYVIDKKIDKYKYFIQIDREYFENFLIDMKNNSTGLRSYIKPKSIDEKIIYIDSLNNEVKYNKDNYLDKINDIEIIDLLEVNIKDLDTLNIEEIDYFSEIIKNLDQSIKKYNRYLYGEVTNNYLLEGSLGSFIDFILDTKTTIMNYSDDTEMYYYSMFMIIYIEINSSYRHTINYLINKYFLSAEKDVKKKLLRLITLIKSNYCYKNEIMFHYNEIKEQIPERLLETIVEHLLYETYSTRKAIRTRMTEEQLKEICDRELEDDLLGDDFNIDSLFEAIMLNEEDENQVIDHIGVETSDPMIEVQGEMNDMFDLNIDNEDISSSDPYYDF